MNTEDMFKSIPMANYSDSSKPTTNYNNIRDVSLESIQQRMIPRQMVTGSTRGTQTVGYGGTKIDGSNNRITIENSADGSSVGMGKIPDSNDFGFFSLDADDNVVMKIVLGTFYVYDGEDDRMQAGILPDGTINVAIAKDGEAVSDAFSS